MAKLTSKARGMLSSKQFAMPKQRKYPVNDKAHAKNAKARASQQEKKGNLSPSEKSHIDSIADRVLGKKRKR